jgi:uncharacterized membrane protein
MGLGLRRLMPVDLATWALFTSVAWRVWLPYFIGAAVSVIGLVVIGKQAEQRHGLDKIIALAPLFIAVPIAVFGTEHFTYAESIAGMVPSWIPGHLFWALFVGASLISGALSMVVRKHAWLAAALFGIMLLLFELLISIPGVVAAPRNRFLWAVALRDLSFSGGALAFAATQTETCKTRLSPRVVTVARLFIGIPIVFFGVEHFLHPEFAPGVPLAKLTPLWIPARLFLAYLTGAVFVVTGLFLIVNKEARLAAAWLGLMILALVLIVYVPIAISNPSSIVGLNYLFDTLLLSGTALAFAGAQREESKNRAA